VHPHERERTRLVTTLAVAVWCDRAESVIRRHRAPSLAQFAAAAHARRHSPCAGTAIKGRAAAGMSYTAAEGKQNIITLSAIPEYYQVEVNPSRCVPGARIRLVTEERIAFIEQYFRT
jgi:hypothetical protein